MRSLSRLSSEGKKGISSALSLFIFIALLSFSGLHVFAQSKSVESPEKNELKSVLSQSSAMGTEAISFKEAESAVLKAAPFLEGEEHRLERLERISRYISSDLIRKDNDAIAEQIISAKATTTSVTSWQYSCSDGKKVEIFGKGINGQTSSTINIPNSANVNLIYAEIIYKGGNPGSSITIQGQTAYRTVPIGGSSDVYVYRAQIPKASSVTYTNSSSTSKLQSFVLYVERNVVGYQSSGLFTERSGYNDIQTINVAIPTSSSSRNLTINVPISEMTNDNRYLMIKATAGSSSTSKFIYSSDKTLGDCCLNIVTLELNNVPGSVNSVAIVVDTRHNQNGQSGVNGQSWVLGSAIAINGVCNPAPLSCTCLSYNLASNPNFDSNANNWIAPKGQFARYTGISSGGYGILNNSNYDDDYTVYQDIALGENKYYKLTGDAAKHSTSNNAYLRLEFYQGNTLIGMTPDYNVTKNFDGSLQSITPIEGFTPDGTDKVRIYGYARKTALKFDNIVLSTCYPEVAIGNTIKVKPECGTNTGSIEVQATGGSGEYQYKINSGNYQTSNKFTGLGQGTYTIQVKDKNTNCTKTASVTLDCEVSCPYTISDPDPSTAEVNPSQVFDLSVKSDGPGSVYIEWVRSTQNVTSLDQLTNKVVVGGGYVSNGGVSIQVTAPSSVGTYYYYAIFKPQDPCGTFAKHIIKVKNIGTNDPVCLSGARAITDNLLQGACNPSATTYYSVWLDLKSSNGKPNYQHFTSSDLKFEEYCDGTAKIWGKACAVGGGSNDCINVVYNLSNRTQTTPSNSPKANSCSTYGNDLYYYKDASGTITGISGGIYNGMDITIADNSGNNIPAFQVGSGANVNTNNFGASGWYTLSFNSSGSNGWSAKTDHGDFNFNLGALIPFELEASASATSICLDGSATLNAQFKGEVPTSCLLNYSWKAPGGSVVSTSQSFTINNIKEDQAGVYTVTASFVSNGKTCSATSTVNIVVDSNCGGTPVCLPNCTPQTMVYWNLNQCNTGTGGNWYGEFEPTISKQGCSDIEATTVYRINPDTNKHSCADGPDGSDAMCVDGVSSTSKPGQNNSKAVRFSTTITPGANKTYNLAELSFKYKRSGYQCNSGGSQSLVLYVYKNGVKVYDERIDGLTTSWKSKTVSFGGTADFVSDAAATYDFELVGFNPTGGCTVWEIDEVKLNGCCGNSVAQPVINVSNANICKGESVTLTASNCNGSLSWSNGATTASITVSPQVTTTYLVSCSLGECSAQQSVEVTVDPNCNNNVCLTCDPKTVVKWNLNTCQALTGAYTYSEFLPQYPNSGNFSSVSATNVYRDSPNDNFHSCVVGFSGNANTDRAMCVSANVSSSADWSKAVKFSATFTPSQIGDITALKFNQRAASVLNYSPDPASSGGTANNNYPKKYSIRIYKGGTLVYESLNRSTSPTNWTTENIDLSNDPDFEITSATTFEFQLTAFDAVGNGANRTVWDLDNIEIIACNKSDIITVTASNDSPKCIGSDITLTANSQTSGLTYSWSGPSEFGTKTGSSVSTSLAGTYTVTVTSTNSCSATATTKVTFKPQPTISVNSQTVCQGTSTSLTATGCNGQVTWNTGASGNILVINNATTTKEYIATCSENGCTASAKGIVLVEDCTDNCIPPTDDEFEICENEVLTDDVSSNDVLPTDAFDVKYSLKSGTSNGSVSVSDNGEFSYTPLTGFSGTDSFVYKQEYKINDPIQGYSSDNAVLNGCGSNKIINTYVKGLEGGGQTNTISIPNPTNLNSAIVEVWIENGSCTNTITIEGQTATGAFVVRTNGQPDTEKIFRTTLSSISADGIININAGNGSCQMSSVAVYVERDQIGGASSYLSSDTDLYHGYVSNGDDCVTVNIPIGGSSQARDIDFTIPLHEKDNVRPVKVTITAGGVTKTITTTGGNNGVGLAEITLINVPATAEIAQITVCSPDGNGDSFGIGAVSAAVAECTPPSVVCIDSAKVTIVVHPKPKGNIPAVEAVCEGGEISLKSGVWTNANKYSWTGPNGFSSNQQNPTISSATEAAEGVYTLTVTSVENCTATATINVTIFKRPSGGSIGYDESKCGGYDPEEIVNLTSPTGENCGGPDITGDDICDSGSGKPVSMTFLYNGKNCSESLNSQGTKGGKWDCQEAGSGPNGDANVYIVVNNGQYTGNVAIGSEFTLTNGGSTLTNPVEISIYSQQGGSLLQYVEVHTSCSAPIVIGDQFGSLVLNQVKGSNSQTYGGSGGIKYSWQSKIGSGSWNTISGATGLTYNPDYITTTTQYRRVTTNCCGLDYSNIVTKTVKPQVFANAGVDKTVCDGGTVTLTGGVGYSTGANGFLLKSEPENTSIENNIKFKKDGSEGPRLLIYQNGSTTPIILLASQRARIESEGDHQSHNHDDIAVGYDGKENDRSLIKFDLNSISGKVDKAELVLKSEDTGNTTVGIYPISTKWNADKVTWLKSDQGINWNTPGVINPGDPLLASQIVTSKQDYKWDVTSVVDGWVNGFPNTPGNYSYLWSTGATTQNITVSPNTTTTYTLTVTDNSTGCTDTDQVIVEVTDETLEPGKIGPDQSNCGPFDPTVINSIEDASGECKNTVVEDCCDSGDKPVSFVLKYKGGSCQDSQNNQGEIGGKWDCTGGNVTNSSVFISANNGQFSGTVGLNNNFTVSNGGVNNLTNPVVLSIYDSQGGALLQTVEIHTSCSAPIVNGDKFGALVLQSSVFKNGIQCEGANNSLDYQWQVFETGQWVDILNANQSTYDPPFTSVTTKYRRNATNCCGTRSSNEVTITIFEGTDVSVTKTDVTCFDGTNGTATATATKGKPSFTYLWSNGQTGATATGLTAASYTVTVTDANNCTATASVVISQPDKLELTKTVIDPNCEKSNGSIDLSVSGGTSPYTYDWSNGAITQDISSLPEGIYSVTVTDKNNCSASLAITLSPKDCVFDLALIKQPKTAGLTYKPGDNVTFTITVHNQGTVTAKDIQVSDYIPTGLILNDPSWSTPVAGITVLNTPIASLAPGANVTRDISFKIATNAQGVDLINRAEISAASNDKGLPDIDSKPDNIADNDAGGVPNSPTDDKLDGNGTDDEDDADPAQITVQKYDLALIKQMTTPSQVIREGDNVSFTITVHNQGTIAANGIELTDYIPAGMTLNDASWTAVGTDKATKVIAGPLAAGANTSTTIILKVGAGQQGKDLVNRAEISKTDDKDNNGNPLVDIDSKPDNIADNDAGGVPNSPTDDKLDGNGTDDEDDADPAQITVQKYDLALIKKLKSTGDIKPGENATFTVTVYNQGTIEANGIEVTDYIPVGMTLNDPLWTAVGTDKAKRVIPGSLAVGANTSIDIVLKVDANFEGTSLINKAEISSTTDKDNNGNPLVDIDSTPDDVDQDKFVNDDDITGDGKNGGDEDDHDPAEIEIKQILDLALTKKLKEGQSLEVGCDESVKYVITVFNQGTLKASNIEITDYIPAGLSLNTSQSNGWSMVAGNAKYTIAGPILPGQNTTVNIVLDVLPTAITGQIVNRAEISNHASNTLNLFDVDSKPNTVSNDDAGGLVSSAADDYIDGNGTGTIGDGIAATDEDDSDPALVIMKEKPTVTASSNGPKCYGEEITLTALGNATNYSWSGPNSFSASGASVVINALPINNGTYTVTASLNGCSATATVIVNQAPQVTASITGTNLLCNGDQTGKATLTAGGGTGTLTYKWSNNATTKDLSGL
ncbi:MAG: Ig-like domain-containing protein, partial [Cytophagales bacterium]|nr:Ig-like domain-containing protein [Cytophagales bacterium]